MVNLNAMDFGKGNEWDGLWSERNQWDRLWSEGNDRDERWNMIIEFNNVTGAEVRLSDYVMMWWKPVTEQWVIYYLGSEFYKNPFENAISMC